MQAQQSDLQQQQWAATQAQQSLLQAQLQGGGRIEAAATASLLWSLGSIACFCFPVPAIIGIVMGLRARTLAQSLRLSLPVRATIGLVISALSSVSCVVFMIWAVVSSQHDLATLGKRKTELEKQIGTKASATSLDQPTACALAELKILNDGHNGVATYFHGYACPGKIATSGDRATLEDFQYYETTSSGPLKKVTICFKHGALWYVDEIRDDGKCAGDDSLAASAIAEPTAAPPPHPFGGNGHEGPRHDAGSHEKPGSIGATPAAHDAGAIHR
jgi:hypothetical protein